MLKVYGNNRGGRIMDKEYELYQVIVQDEKGKLYNLNSDYMNENFEVTEHDILIPLEGEE
jgi:hypothetical protein